MGEWLAGNLMDFDEGDRKIVTIGGRSDLFPKKLRWKLTGARPLRHDRHRDPDHQLSTGGC